MSLYNIKDLIAEIAPEEEYSIRGKSVIVRRDDLAFKSPLPPNAKMAALYELVKRAAEQGYKKVVMFAKKQQGTSYAIGLPVFCSMFDIEPIITVPMSKAYVEANTLTEWQLEAIGRGARLERLHPNMVSINVNQSKKIAEAEGAYFIPFGFDDALSVEAHANKFSLPDYKIGTLITATMTGMILAGLVTQIYRRGYEVEKLYGISCGRPVENVFKSMNKYITYLYEAQLLDYLEFINPYPRNFIPAFKEERFPLHPDYEAKAWYWLYTNIDSLQEPIYFINVGR